jgi:hypothetical protein
VGALIAASAGLLGCSSCPASTSVAEAVGHPVTLDATTAQASYVLTVHAPEQSCGCRWCDEPPLLSLAVTAPLQWSSPSEAVAEPVVRFTLTPRYPPSDADALVPALPLDVVLTGKAPSSEPVVRATHLCPDNDECNLSYQLTVQRVEPSPAGAIGVTLTFDATFPTKPDGSLAVSVLQ